MTPRGPLQDSRGWRAYHRLTEMLMGFKGQLLIWHMEFYSQVRLD